ncbi:hypothetical protein Hanom_Chr12g01121191 [Helianthus anomalus]
MDSQASLEVIKGHNKAGYLLDPWPKYCADFKSVRENPIIYIDMIQDFLENGINQQKRSW